MWLEQASAITVRLTREMNIPNMSLLLKGKGSKNNFLLVIEPLKKTPLIQLQAVVGTKIEVHLPESTKLLQKWSCGRFLRMASVLENAIVNCIVRSRYLSCVLACVDPGEAIIEQRPDGGHCIGSIGHHWSPLTGLVIDTIGH